MDGRILPKGWESIKLVDKGFHVFPSKNHQSRKWELRLDTPGRPWDDLVNCIATDSSEDRLLVLATENGLIYVFDIPKNRMLLCFQADQWIGSLVVSRRSALVSTFSFRVREYNLRSGRLTHDIAASTKLREGFGPKGIIFTELKKGELLLFNSGYLAFKIYSMRLKKVLREFSPFPADNRGEGEARGNLRPLIMNYDLNKKFRLVTMLLKDDPHLYLWDMKTFKSAGQLKLYNPEDLPRNMILVNSSVLNEDDYIFVLLQFLNNENSDSRKVSVIVIVKIEDTPAGKIAKVMLYEKISKQG